MASITLSAEEIRAASPEVQAWIEQRVAAIFRPAGPDRTHPEAPPLVACTLADARGVLAQIQNLLPVVGVFFELGREGPVVGPQGLRVLTLTDMQLHAHLRSPDQVLECLNIVNQALRRVRDDVTAMICSIDPEGHCFVTEATSKAIQALWRDIVGSHDPRAPATSAAAP
jgi:hypothetical protein